MGNTPAGQALSNMAADEKSGTGYSQSHCEAYAKYWFNGASGTIYYHTKAGQPYLHDGNVCVVSTEPHGYGEWLAQPIAYYSKPVYWSMDSVKP